MKTLLNIHVSWSKTLAGILCFGSTWYNGQKEQACCHGPWNRAPRDMTGPVPLKWESLRTQTASSPEIFLSSLRRVSWIPWEEGGESEGINSWKEVWINWIIVPQRDFFKLENIESPLISKCKYISVSEGGFGHGLWHVYISLCSSASIPHTNTIFFNSLNGIGRQHRNAISLIHMKKQEPEELSKSWSV